MEMFEEPKNRNSEDAAFVSVLWFFGPSRPLPHDLSRLHFQISRLTQHIQDVLDFHVRLRLLSDDDQAVEFADRAASVGFPAVHNGVLPRLRIDVGHDNRHELRGPAIVIGQSGRPAKWVTAWRSAGSRSRLLGMR